MSAPSSAGTLLVRAPSPHLLLGQTTHIPPPSPTSISPTLAHTQWTTYISHFQRLGWTILPVPPLPSHPDSVFIEDAVVFFGRTAVIASPGHPSREEEILAVQEFLEQRKVELGIEVRRIEKPATLDGGDVLKVGKTVYVGDSRRTNQEGRNQLRKIVEELGYELRVVRVTKALHLKSAITALPDGTFLGYEPIVDDPSLFSSFLSVPEEHGVAVVILSPTDLLMSSDAPRTARLLRDRGYQVHTTDIDQFEKLEGCVTCLSVRIRP
ncbi:hypothetical protein ACQY0O_003840 [Thecaphora frezii]